MSKCYQCIITVNIFRLFLVKDNVDEFALRSFAAGAIGGIGGAKLLALLDDPFGSLFCESKIFSRESFKDFVDRKDNNLFQDIFENFFGGSFVDINEIEWLNERDTTIFGGKIISSLLGLDRPFVFRNFIFGHR